MPERAWVSDLGGMAAVDAELTAVLVGRDIVAARYVGLEYLLPVMEGRRFHALDYGFELDLAGGSTWSATWDQMGSNEGLRVAPGPVPVAREGDVVSWDFSAPWRERFPRGVRRVETVWTQHTWVAVEDRHDRRVSDLCLTTVLLDDVVVTLGGGDGTEFARPQFDMVSVFWSVADARTAGALLPGDEGAISA